MINLLIFQVSLVHYMKANYQCIGRNVHNAPQSNIFLLLLHNCAEFQVLDIAFNLQNPIFCTGYKELWTPGICFELSKSS